MPFGGRDQHHQPDRLRPALPEQRDRLHRRPAGREHRVDDQGLARGDVGGQLAVVRVRRQRVGVAVDPDVADAGGRHQPQHPGLHRETGAQDRDDGEFLAGERRAPRHADRRLHLDGAQRQVARHLERHEHREFFDELAKLLVPGPHVPEHRQLVLDQRMVEHAHLAHARPPWCRSDVDAYPATSTGSG